MATLGSRMRKLRKVRGWTLEDVANKLGLRGHSTYSNWEYNRTEPDAEMLAKVAAIFNVSTDYLLTGKSGDENEDPKRQTLIDEVKTMSEEDLDYFLDFVKRTKRK